jgi:hypothetical protein
MKKLFLAVAAFTLSTGLFAQKTAADVAKFTTETIDQGKLKQNSPEDAVFIVTNISKEPLLIEQANPTCGCTMGDYTKTPIPPGGTGKITARFNAAGAGNFEKHLTVKFAGVDEMKSITIKGVVLTEPEYVQWKAENAATMADAAKTAKPAVVATPATAKAAAKATVAAKKGKKGKRCTNC